MNNQNKQDSSKVSVLARIKKVKHIEIIVAVVAVLIMLAIYFGGIGGIDQKPQAKSVDSANYCTFMQQELEELVSNLKGAGKAKVLINWESSIELILAETKTDSTGSTSSSPVIVQGSGVSAPVILKEIYPKVVGVVIICQGASDPKIKINIITAVSTLLNISSDKVIVYTMSK